MRRRSAFIKVALLAALAPSCGGSGSGTAAPVFFVSTASLPIATQSVAYTATLLSSGGTAPITWSLTSGALPSGLTLAPATGVISGTPTAIGPATFTVRAVDSGLSPFTASKVLGINVTSAGTQYDPPWASIAPVTTIVHSYNGGQTSAQNG